MSPARPKPPSHHLVGDADGTHDRSARFRPAVAARTAELAARLPREELLASTWAPGPRNEPHGTQHRASVRAVQPPKGRDDLSQAGRRLMEVPAREVAPAPSAIMPGMTTRRTRRVVHDDPPLDFCDVARIQWEAYVESRVDHQYAPRVTPTRKRVRRSRLRSSGRRTCSCCTCEPTATEEERDGNRGEAPTNSAAADDQAAGGGVRTRARGARREPGAAGACRDPRGAGGAPRGGGRARPDLGCKRRTCRHQTLRDLGEPA